MAKKKGRSGLTEEQLRFLFASGILGHSGSSGKSRGKVIYSRSRSNEIKKLAGKGHPALTFRQKGSTHIGASNSKAFAGRPNHNTNAAKSNPYGVGRHVLGEKAAHLRGGNQKKIDAEVQLHPRAQAYAQRKMTMSAEQLKAERLDRQYKGLQKAFTTMRSNDGKWGRKIEANWTRQGKLFSTREIERKTKEWGLKRQQKQKEWEKRSGIWMSKYRPLN